MDPHGYIEGAELPDHHPGFQRLKKQGDMVATLMGWLEDVELGGATAFAAKGNIILYNAIRLYDSVWLLSLIPLK